MFNEDKENESERIQEKNREVFLKFAISGLTIILITSLILALVL